MMQGVKNKYKLIVHKLQSSWILQYPKPQDITYTKDSTYADIH